jgi:hypothetical protein
MFKAEDLHPKLGKYRHIIVPQNTKSVKVKFKDGDEQADDPKPEPRRPLEFRRYRDDA